MNSKYSFDDVINGLTELLRNNLPDDNWRKFEGNYYRLKKSIENIYWGIFGINDRLESLFSSFKILKESQKEYALRAYLDVMKYSAMYSKKRALKMIFGTR